MHPELTWPEDLTKGALVSGQLRGWITGHRRPVAR